MKSISTLLCLVASVTPALSQTLTMGAALGYGAYAVSGITSTGTSHVNGSIAALNKGIIGFPPGVFTGTEATGTGATAQQDAIAAIKADAAELTATTTLPASIGSGETLTPGVYSIAKTGTISGALTLSGAGQFVFKVGDTLETAALSSVTLADGAVSSDVFWIVASAVTIAGDSTFAGNIMSGGTMIVASAAVIDGGVFSGSTLTLEGVTIDAST